jgi:protein phosphatase
VSDERARIEVFGVTDPGRVRQLNQDQFLIADLAKTLEVRQTSLRRDTAGSFSDVHAHVLLVADGMGGHAAGGEASAIAVETIRSYLVHTMPWILSLRPGRETSAETDDELKRALERCHEAVLAAGRSRPDREGMGTTMTLVYVVWPWLYLVHVGDSRCYLLRGDRFERITRDHTYAQKLIEEGGLTREQAEDSFLSNVLTRVIGGDTRTLEVDAYKASLEVGDRLLLATDGLNKHVKDREVHRILERSESSEEACRALIEATLEGGGSDNVTTVVASFLPES